MTQHNPQGKHPQREPLPSGAVYGGVAQQQRPVRVGMHGDTPIAPDDREVSPSFASALAGAGLFDRRAVRQGYVQLVATRSNTSLTGVCPNNNRPRSCAASVGDAVGSGNWAWPAAAAARCLRRGETCSPGWGSSPLRCRCSRSHRQPPSRCSMVKHLHCTTASYGPQPGREAAGPLFDPARHPFGNSTL